MRAAAVGAERKVELARLPGARAVRRDGTLSGRRIIRGLATAPPMGATADP
jgi:hypothetical protein